MSRNGHVADLLLRYLAAGDIAWTNQGKSLEDMFKQFTPRKILEDFAWWADSQGRKAEQADCRHVILRFLAAPSFYRGRQLYRCQECPAVIDFTGFITDLPAQPTADEVTT